MATIRIEGKRWVPSGQSGARLLWEMQRGWQRLGPTAALGILCALLAVGAWWQTRHGIEQQKQLQQKIIAEKIRAHTRVPETGPSASDLDLARQLTAFYAYLPAHNALPDQVKQLLVLAQKHGVTLAQAEYKVLPETNAAFLRYHMILPVKAEARPIQNFMQAALHTLPALTLESVAFKRERGDSAQLEARIQFQLLVKKPVGKGALP